MQSSYQPSFVIGNSWEVSELTPQEKNVLDTAPWVFTCNGFLEHWKMSGFRPTVWMMGDTVDGDDHSCEMMSRQIFTIRHDRELQQRLRSIYVCVESEFARKLAVKGNVPITFYRRGEHVDFNQVWAKNFYEPLYHLNTFMDMLNAASILNPGNQIRVFGCQRGNCEHFYTGRTNLENSDWFPDIRMWEAFAQLHSHTIQLVDCNRRHSTAIEDVYQIPTGSITDDWMSN